MTKIAFILLCHQDPAGIIRQAERLTATGDTVAIHFDGRASEADFQRIRAALKDRQGVVFAGKRHKCGWGGWSLIAATLSALEAAIAADPQATHFYLISGDCMAIKPAEFARAYLEAEDVDHIESVDFFESGWIKTGMRADRLVYRHFFNERTQKRLFYGALNLQRRLGLKRPIPHGLQMMIGSQWWCLRRRTVDLILGFLRDRPDVVRFFKTTWIPDETFFQTLVRHLVPGEQIRARAPTFLMFSDYGMPVSFHDDHYDLLRSQDYLFARKIDADARRLQARLGDLWAATGAEFTVSAEGPQLYRYLAERGREGRRFAPRIWEAETRPNAGQELMIVLCKKWHVGKRLTRMVRDQGTVPALDYAFDELAAALPDLGGIENSLDKRRRHCRSFVALLFRHFGTDRLMICLDPAQFGLLQDLRGGWTRARTLAIDCEMSDDYLAGHARRIGVVGADARPEALARLLPTIRRDLEHERARIGANSPSGHHRVRRGDTPEAFAATLAAFLGAAQLPEPPTPSDFFAD